jgi:hypothetical protein
MERELMPDYQAEAFYRYLIPEDVFGGLDENQEEAEPGVVSCKREAPHSRDTRNGVAVAGGYKNYFNDEVFMMTPAPRAVLLLKKLLKKF